MHIATSAVRRERNSFIRRRGGAESRSKNCEVGRRGADPASQGACSYGNVWRVSVARAIFAERSPHRTTQ